MSRFREKRAAIVAATCTQIVTPVSGPSTTNVVYDVKYCPAWTEMTDSVVPGFHKRRARGEIFNNPVSVVGASWEPGSGSYNATRPGWSSVNRIGAAGAYQASAWGRSWATGMKSVDVDPLIRHACQQAVAGIDRTPFRFGEDVAEIASTIRFLKSPARGLHELVRRLSKKTTMAKRKWKKAADVTLAVNDLYLTDRFVIKPIVKSMMDIVEASRMRLDITKPVRRMSRGFAQDLQTNNVTTIDSFGSGKYDEFNIITSNEVSIRAYVLYDIKSSDNTAFRLGLRVDDLPTTLWEIVPLSFMVDRVYDVSAAIRGAIALTDPRLNVLASGYTTHNTRKGSCTWIRQVQPNWTISVSGSPSVGEETGFGRHPGLDTTNISVVVPVFRPMALIKDITSIADLLGLTASILTRSYNPSLRY